MSPDATMSHDPTDGPDRPIAADWLTLRRPFDESARETTWPLWRELATWLLATPNSDPVQMFDLGAGTGANQAYLQPRLPFPTAWTLLDHDASLLSHPGQGPGRRVLAGVQELPRLLDGSSKGPAPIAAVVSCSALLDLLSVAELDGLSEALLSRGVPGLFALTVTGEVSSSPPDDGDELVASAFDAHQARAGRPGPKASAHLAAACRARGAHLSAIPTPWHIDTADPASRPFARRWLSDRAAAALEQAPDSAPALRAWVARRLAQIEGGTFRAVVGHEDLLVLP